MLTPYDDNWPREAARRLTDLRRVFEPLDPDCAFDHIGSTSVPGLTAKPFIDLQVRIPRLPDAATLDPPLLEIGFLAHAGSRPDSPGVHRDSPRGSLHTPAEVWEKRLFTAEDPDTVLHVRRSDSPWGGYTVMFRDWLRAHPDEAARYAKVKRSLALEHADDPDYDDYTRAKTAYFDEVQQRFETWADTSAAR
ncbi:MAG: hypothetical protein JWR85_3393 [Marmoricola sp.]|nr:hypothetical protein [Marmoricola sp.]